MNRQLPQCARTVAGLLHVLFWCAATCGFFRSAAAEVDSSDRIIAYLEQRTSADPQNASTWRTLGRACLDAERLPEARDALERSLELDPANPAAHHDFAELLESLGDAQAAANHYQQAVDLAPDSEYARMAESRLVDLPPPEGEGEIIAVGYEIKRFDGSEVLEERQVGPFDDVSAPAVPAILARVEFGALYNSNVALTPSSREFALSEAGSAQAYANADLEYWLIERDSWRAGPLFSGSFTVNESDFSALNLQSYQPGVFIERSLFLDNTVLIPRIQYDYTLDQFDGVTFANRHAVTSSLISFWDSGDASVAYWSIDHTDFANDGATPATTSRDGLTNSLGVSHVHYIGRRWLDTLTAGADVQIVNADGDNFAYNGVSLFTAAEVPLTQQLSLILEGGWGYRDYHRAAITPSRNENVWRSGARLLHQINEFWSLAGVFSYNRFDSENPLFDAERVVGGVVTIVEY